MNTLFHLSQYASRELKDTYTAHEIKYLCNLIFTDVLRYTNIDIHIKKHEVLDESFVNKFYEIVTQLKTNQPLQYIIGSAEFSGLRFGLNGSTLIPRPETEELVIWAGSQLRSGMTVLDIGTGSGCIAVSLAAMCAEARITGIDISDKAIGQAKENAAANGTEVNFQIRDILNHEQYEWDTYDLIVSNPPYVRQSEKTAMHSRVLDFEPHRALFVPDDDPLMFYRRIAEFGLQHLAAGGCLFFEINEALGKETAGLLTQLGYQETVLKKDIHERDRFIRTTAPR